jgi:hypothetical protein
MTLKSAFDDLSRTTLKAISGCLRRLDYLAGLRAKDGEYEHWGFGKTYGQANASKAIAAAHREAVSEVLSTPLGTLLEDVETSTQAAGVEVDSYLEKLSDGTKSLLPQDPGPGSARHLSSVLHALLGLERNRKRGAIRRAS